MTRMRIGARLGRSREILSVRRSGATGLTEPFTEDHEFIALRGSRGADHAMTLRAAGRPALTVLLAGLLTAMGCGPAVMSIHANGNGGAPSGGGAQYHICESSADARGIRACTGPRVTGGPTADGPHAYLPTGCQSIQQIVIENLNGDLPRVTVWCVAATGR